MTYKKWTAEEINYLKDKWNVETTENIAISLGRSYNSVMNKALYIGLGPNNKKKIAKRNWTKANYIDRSAQACSGKIERLIKEGVIFPRSEFRTSC